MSSSCYNPVPHHNLELQGNYIRRLFRQISVFKLCAGNNCHKQKHSFYILNATQFDVRPNFWRHVFQLITWLRTETCFELLRSSFYYSSRV